MRSSSECRLPIQTSANVLKYILIAINYQAVILTAWAGVALAYITSHASAKTRDPSTATAPLSAPGLIAWSVGAVVGLVMIVRGGFVATLSVPATLAIGFTLYIVLPEGEARASPRFDLNNCQPRGQCGD